MVNLDFKKNNDEQILSKNIFRVAKNRMFSAVNAYYIWKHLGMAININNAGSTIAEKNVKIINEYGYFFNQLFPSTYKCFVIDLSIFFDSGDGDAFSIKKLLLTLKNKLSDSQIDELRNEINKIKSKHGVKIGFIQELRNTDVAHQKITPQSIVIKYAEMEELFYAVQDILNLISKHYDDSTTVWDHLETYIKNDIKIMLDNLERGERVRINEIHKKYN